MKATLRLATVLIPLWAGGAFAAPGQPVRIDSGPIAGTVENGIAVWRGIPYAAPPVGPLRWREPQPVAPWTETRQATAFSPTCIQAASWDKQPRSEDCLTLNVWAPADYSGQKLPVMVWIHGGGLHSGSGSQPLYFGDQLPRRGVILVTLNYRLGLLGFFSHPELSAESPSHASGNQGLLDQIAALQWVHRNIAAFGGDPARVTLFGESAGSAAVKALMASPLTDGLFQAAIGESGADRGHVRPEQTRKGAEEQGRQFAEGAGAHSLADLRALSVGALYAKPWRAMLVVDGHAETEGASEAYEAHHQRDVPLMLGWNADEGVDLAGEPAAGQGRKATQAEIDRPQTAMAAAMWGWAQEQATDAKSPAYAYYFLHVPPEPATPCGYGCRAGHGAELPYIFGHLDDRPWRPEDLDLAAHMVSYWTNLAKTGNPNGGGLPRWQPFDGKAGSVLRLGTAAEIAERGKFPDYAAVSGSP